MAAPLTVVPDPPAKRRGIQLNQIVDSFPTEAEAEKAKWDWGQKLVRMKWHHKYGMIVRKNTDPAADEYHQWGIFCEPHDEPVPVIP